MSYDWKQWEGQTVNDSFPLHQYLGASEHDAVYATERAGATPSRAAIKIIPAEFTDAERQLFQWRESAELSHPNLLRLFEYGRAQMGSTPVVYVVMEYADEDLSQILPERALSPAECGAMLQPIIEALSYVHGRGMVHGQVRPANVVAVGNTVKLTSDTVQKPGSLLVKDPEFPTPYDAPEVAQKGASVASDVWALGATMMEALTQDPPLVDPDHPEDPPVLALPEPFLTTITNCLRVDPAMRWPLQHVQLVIAARPEPAVQPDPVTAAPPVSVQPVTRSARPGWHLAAAVVLALFLLAVIAFFAMRGHESTAQPESSPASSPASSPVATETTKSRESATSSASDPAKLASSSGDVVHQDIPEVSAGARRTIQGTVRVNIRVSVDPKGDVTATAFETHGPSAYFARVARESAREWKFSAPQVEGKPVASDWVLKYQFRRDGTKVTPALENP